MTQRSREAFSTLAGLTLYIGVAPFVVTWLLMLIADVLGAGEAWAGIFAVIYTVLVGFGSREFVKRNG